MKKKTDLVAGLVKKAKSDLQVIDASIKVGSYDAACFHSQQAAEKLIKAFLTERESKYPFSHNLIRLLECCIELDASFTKMIDVISPLTPYAVELRYDFEFWPSVEESQDALLRVKKFYKFITPKLTGYL